MDEVGFQTMTRQEASLFFRLVSARYQRGATLITTNKSVKDWPEILAGDEVMATALLDRLPAPMPCVEHQRKELSAQGPGTGSGRGEVRQSKRVGSGRPTGSLRPTRSVPR